MEEDGKIKQRVYHLIDRMSRKIGIEIPRDQYPEVRIEKDAVEYRMDINELAFDPKYIHSGEILGEEIGHFIREYAKNTTHKKPLPKLLYYMLHPLGNELKRVPSVQRKKEIHTDEFFGYLGSKILQEITTEKDNIKFGSKLSSAKPIAREEKLHHIRPYRFARQINLSKITDYAQLFSLPDQEVRHRFFRSDPQYNLSKPAPEAKITRKNQANQNHRSTLESIVKIIAPILLIASIFLVSTKAITGNAILNLNNYYDFSNAIPIIAILIIGLIFVIVVGLKRRKQ